MFCTFLQIFFFSENWNKFPTKIFFSIAQKNELWTVQESVKKWVQNMFSVLVALTRSTPVAVVGLLDL